MVICQVCGEEPEKLDIHVRVIHGMTNHEYYDTYIKQETEGKCVICGKPTKFVKIEEGYRKTCSRACNMRHVLNEIQADPERNEKWKKAITNNLRSKQKKH